MYRSTVCSLLACVVGALFLSAPGIAADDPGPNDPGPDALFPMDVGHRWTYEQQLTEGDSTLTREQVTIMIDVQSVEEYDIFRALTRVDGIPSIALFTARNDSIFQVVPRPNGGSGLALMYFTPEGAQEFESWVTVEEPINWTASPAEGPVTVPAGTYEGCYVFEHSSEQVDSRAVLAPGVGVIEQQIVQRDHGQLRSRAVIRLKSFEPHGALDEGPE